MLKTNKRCAEVKPYIPGQSKIEGVTEVIKLASNENPLGASPDLKQAMAEALEKIHLYPEDPTTSLKAAISKVQNLPSEQIFCGRGSDEILELLPSIYTEQGDEVIYTQYGFLVYPEAARKEGAIAVEVPEKDYRVDVDAILKGVTAKTKIVYVANPGNPTGTYIPKNEMQRLREQLPETILLVIDSAYAECVTAPDYSDGREIAANTENTIMTRTFSKMYGIAGLRVGWGYAHQSIINALEGKRPPFNMTGPSIAGGVAAVKDQVFLQKSIAHNTKSREALSNKLNDLGFSTIPSQGNFVTAHFGNADRAFDYLIKQGIIVRKLIGYKLPEFLRISIGSDVQMEKLFGALEKYSELAKTADRNSVGSMSK